MPAPIRLTMLAALDPARARRDMLAALRAEDGNLSRAAVVLGVARITAFRLIDRLGLRDEIDRRWPDPRRSGRRTAGKHVRNR